jgi:[ribosomal protein S5]-alanine N-acetyltransferase
MELKTKRLILRQMTHRDVNDIVEHINNINVSKWLLVVPYPYKVKDAKFWINQQKKEARNKERDNYQFGIELKSEKKIIGGIGLNKINKSHNTSTIGYWIGEKYWRNGYGTEALKGILDFSFKKLKLRRIEAGVLANNPSSGKLLEKYGFKLEGLRRKAVICKADKRIEDEYIYGLLREEYRPK